MRFKILIVFILFLPLIAFAQVNTTYTLKVLGVVQDGGLPHLGSNKLCCDEAQSKRHVTSLMLINNGNNYSYLFDASPDINEQLNFMGDRIKKDLKGIFLTHAHIGHYTGLMYFGREALNSKSINVYAMPRMKKFLEQNGPWSQLVSLENILITELNNYSKISVDSNVIIQPFEVPHRPEFSETVGYKIYGPNKKALFIPDIDKWEKWDKNLVKLVREFDYILIDATFYDSKEINRDISEIPHPLVTETMELLSSLSIDTRNKIYFIHMNHTNMMLNPKSELSKLVISKGFKIARLGQKLYL